MKLSKRERREGRFVVRGSYLGDPVEILWQDGRIANAPPYVEDLIHLAVEERVPVYREIAHPWTYSGEATLDDRFLAQATILHVLDDEGAEVSDPIIERERRKWPDLVRRGVVF